MIGRRAVILGLGSTLAASSARAQQPASRVVRVGVLRPGAQPPGNDIQFTGLGTALASLGHVEGRNLVIDHRFADGHLDRLPVLARDLLSGGADIIVAVGSSAAMAARQATATVPIVMFANVDPVALGIVDQLGRPTGNITGILISPDGSLAAKRIWLLKEAVPQAQRFALLTPEADPAFSLQVRETEDAAAAVNLDLVVIGDGRGAYMQAFEQVAMAGAGAMIVGAHQFYVRDRHTIIDLAARFRLPAIYEFAEQVRDGGMMSYGASLTERYARLAFYVDRLLKSTRPRELPFEQPASLQTVINLKTVAALGLRLPDSLIARADEVIE